jgi:peptidoglycan/LPS O-acetylase OafA/YrhL
MTNALSLYLDALRFGAALAVVLSHYVAGRYSGGLLWRLMPYGRTAVLLFFVLSGFVIAWVTETRERSLEEYALSRLARLYSVILPAFLLTAALDHFGSAIDPALYGPKLALSPAESLLGYLLSALFLGDSWTLTVLPGFNVPFWSLNYEAWYYVLFGAATFLRGRRRIAALAAAALLAGPKILLFFPVWLMGLAAWHWRRVLPARYGAPLALGAAAAFVALEAAGGQKLFSRPPETPWLPFGYSPYDYLVGTLVALLILGLANARLPMPAVAMQHLIRWLAATTFGIYLLHYPLLNFFGTVVPGPSGAAMHAVPVFVLTLGTAIVLAHIFEGRKGALKRGLSYALYTWRGRRPCPAPRL